MPHRTVRKLFRSLDELERSIAAAKEYLKGCDPIPFEVLKRINEYERIVQKQRYYGRELAKHVVYQNWSEVSRNIRLINGLSKMVSGDATDLVEAMLAGNLRASTGGELEASEPTHA